VCSKDVPSDNETEAHMEMSEVNTITNSLDSSTDDEMKENVMEVGSVQPQTNNSFSVS